MKKNSVFLCEIFVAILICSHDTKAETHYVCPANYYVEKCGSKVVGTYWLKGIEDPDTNTLTPDYYDYDEVNNLQNFRNFFSVETPPPDIIYTAHDSGNSIGGHMVATWVEFLQYRDIILNATCGNLDAITCTKCPGNGKTSLSYVNIGGDGSLNSWHFNTFADCYMQVFSDASGKYVYLLNEDATLSGTNYQHCYYSNEIKGSTLVLRDYSGGSTAGTGTSGGNTSE